MKKAQRIDDGSSREFKKHHVRDLHSDTMGKHKYYDKVLVDSMNYEKSNIDQSMEHLVIEVNKAKDQASFNKYFQSEQG